MQLFQQAVNWEYQELISSRHKQLIVDVNHSRFDLTVSKWLEKFHLFSAEDASDMRLLLGVLGGLLLAKQGDDLRGIHTSLEKLSDTLHLGKEKICFELLVSALAGISPEIHLRRTAEAFIIRRHQNVVSRIYGRVIQRYEKLLEEEIEVPDHDKTLRPFLEGIANQLKKLEERRESVELMLASAEAARTGGDDFEVLIGLANRARQLAALDVKSINYKSCQELADLLTSLGVKSIIWPSSNNSPSEHLKS